MSRSGTIAPDGIILGETGRYVGVINTVIDLDRPRIVRCYGVEGISNWREQTIRHRRPETYKRIAQTQNPLDGNAYKNQ